MCSVSGGLRLVERDREIMKEVERWRFLLGRQIKVLCGFAGQRACDRRLKKLIDAEYLERKYYIYGIPGLYFVTKKAVEIFNLDFFTPNIRIEQIEHDIAVIDTTIYLISKGVSLKDITTERELKHINGFGNPKHEPDFLYKKEGKTYCVEVELSAKKQYTVEKNIKENYIKYDIQQWFISEGKIKIVEYVKKASNQYANVEIIPLEEVQKYVKSL